MSRQKSLYIILFVLIANTVFSGETTHPAFLPDLRNYAMGGISVSNAKGTFAYTYNPAVLAKGESQFTLAGIQTAFSNEFFDVIDYALDNSDNFRKLDKNYQPKLSTQQSDSVIDYLRREAVALDNIWYHANLIPSIGLTMNNIGVSIYSNGCFAVRPDVGIIVPKFHVQLYDDLILALGYGKYYRKNLAFGMNLKIIRRFETPLVKIQIEEVDNFNDTLEEAMEDMQRGKWGYGIDLGALYHFRPNLNIGVMVQDFLGQVDAINTPMNVKIGVHYQHSPQLALGGEIVDFFNRRGEHLFSKIHLGAEYELSILRGRLGINQGYPTIGVGINLWVLQFNYTFYRYETGLSPGQKSESLHMFDFQIGLD